MIKVTLNDIITNNNLFREIHSKPMPARTAFKVARLIRELDKENEMFDKQRIDIVTRYAKRDENGDMIEENNQVLIDDDKMKQFQDEFNALLDTEVEVNAEKLSIDDLGDIELTPKQIMNLEKFINE